MTSRGRLALALGCATYLAAWAFGSTPLYPVALGLLAAVLIARLWTRLASSPAELRRRLPEVERHEGDDVKVRLELKRSRGYLPSTVLLRERIAKLGERETPLPMRRGSSYVLESLPRGRYVFEESTIVIEDPLGLDRIEEPLEAPGALLVYPRLVELDRLFSESGASAHDGKRLLLRRPAGFDLHSVREYEQGESLRKVHWRSTAKRGQLMVKELEDSPRNEVAVVLDVDPSAVVGESFEVQVRAAGSILLAHARRGRRAVLLANSARVEQRRTRSADRDWRQALDLLASVEPGPGPPLAALLVDKDGGGGSAFELAIVTASLPATLVEQLLNLAVGHHRHVSLVLVDSASFASNGSGAHSAHPGLLKLQAAGIPVAVLRRGDDLAAKLGPHTAREAAFG
ncbi:MAG TPA: DUF58 domain-containing protein [Gaiellaceae bacterium]|nr:DUF58 domain-containing protein [Gaiellaceae bacterium]